MGNEIRKKQFKKDLIFSIIIIIALISLIIYVKVDSYNYHCSNCTIKFSSKMASQRFGNISYSEIDISAIELYYKFMNGSCPVTWDKMIGYVENG